MNQSVILPELGQGLRSLNLKPNNLLTDLGLVPSHLANILLGQPQIIAQLAPEPGELLRLNASLQLRVDSLEGLLLGLRMGVETVLGDELGGGLYLVQYLGQVEGLAAFDCVVALGVELG